ncbi:MAG: MFS transporter [Verrucomicrobiota bacterium]
MYLFFHSLYKDIRAQPRVVYVILLGLFLTRFGTYVFPFLALYLSSLGYSAGHVAAVLAVMGFGNILGPLAGGYLADAIGRKRTMSIALFGSALATLGIYASADRYGLLLAVVFFNGFIGFLYGPASNALLTDLVPADQRVTTFALIRLAMNGGFAAGPAVGGLLYATAPVLMFIGDAFTTLLCATLISVYVPHGLRTIRGKAGSLKVFVQSWKAALSDLRTHHLYKQYLLAIFFMAFGFCQVFSVLAMSTKDTGLSASEYGLIMSVNGLLILLIELPMSHFLKRFAPRRVLAVGFGLIGFGLFGFGMAGSHLGFLLAMILFTLGEIVALPVGMAYSSGLAPEEFRGRYLGLRGITWGVAGALASTGLVIYSEIGIAVWFIAGASSLIGTLVVLLPARTRRKSAASPNLAS